MIGQCNDASHAAMLFLSPCECMRGGMCCHSSDANLLVGSRHRLRLCELARSQSLLHSFKRTCIRRSCFSVISLSFSGGSRPGEMGSVQVGCLSEIVTSCELCPFRNSMRFHHHQQPVLPKWRTDERLVAAAHLMTAGTISSTLFHCSCHAPTTFTNIVLRSIASMTPHTAVLRCTDGGNATKVRELSGQ